MTVDELRTSLTSRGLPAEDCDVRVLAYAIVDNRNCRHCDRKTCTNAAKFTAVGEFVTYKGSLYARYGDCRKMKRHPLMEELIENVTAEYDELF